MTRDEVIRNIVESSSKLTQLHQEILKTTPIVQKHHDMCDDARKLYSLIRDLKSNYIKEHGDSVISAANEAMKLAKGLINE
jgi:hypothetical protein